MTSVVDYMSQPSGNHEPTDTPDPTAGCHTCKRVLHEGEAAWASDWKWLDVEAEVWRNVTRYTCDDCEAKR